MVACSNPSTPPPIPHVDAESAAIARKRRAELLKISRAQNASGSESDEPEMVLAPVVSTTNVVMSQGNKRKISDASSSSSNTSTTKKTTKKKRPTQMRYDPDVPMTKEEAAAWRREARRVRNRQSAAASRQKTRARIEELEVEVESWQKKYAALEAKVRAYELQHCVNVMQSEVVTKSTTVVPSAVHSSGSAVSSNETSVNHRTMASAAAALIDLSPVLSAATEQIEARYNSMKEQHLNIISRPAVKIANVVSSMSSMPHIPDLSVAEPANTVPSVVVASDSSNADVITSDEEDLDEFLIDAFASDIAATI